jgi:hypothetical protein
LSLPEHFKPLLDYARYGVVLWLLCEIVQNTPVCDYGPLHTDVVFLWLLNGSLIAKSTGITLILLIWGSFWRVVFASRSGVALWLLVGCYFATFAFSALKNPSITSQSGASILILASYGLGLLAARISADVCMLARCVVFVVALEAAWAICELLGGVSPFVSGTVVRVGGTYGNPMVIYPLLLFTLPLAGVLLFHEGGKWKRRAWFVCCGLISVTLLLTWYRWGMLSACIGMVWLTSRLTSSTKKIAVAIGVSALLVAGTVAIRTTGTTNHVSAEASWNGRLELWEESVNVIRHQWLFGVGSTQLRLPAYMGHGGNRHHVTMLHPCNLLLLWTCENGVCGGALLLLLCVAAYRFFGERRFIMSYGFGAAWLGVMIASVLDTPFGYVDRLAVNIVAGACIGGIMLLSDVSCAEALSC